MIDTDSEISDNIKEAKNLIKNKQLTIPQILSSFNILGISYLNGEGGYVNDDNGLIELCYDYNLDKKELLKYLRRSYINGYYHPNDKYVSFDGNTVTSFMDLKYFTTILLQKMDGECAEYILNL